MIGVLAFLIEYAVGVHHVVHDVALRDLFRSELLRRRQVLAVIITQVIVRNNASGLDAS